MGVAPACNGDDTMKKTTFFLLVLLVISTLFIYRCPPVPAAQPPPLTTPQTQTTATQLPDTIKKADTAFGAILTDGQGKTLYYFTLDQYTNGGSACDAACVVAWRYLIPIP